MAVIRLGPFLGANVARQAKTLPNEVGVVSENHYPERGDLRPWNVPLAVKTVAAGIKTIYMLGRDATSDTIYWFVWDQVVHAVRSFRASDTTKRTYYSGDGAPKVTDNIIGLAGEPYPTAYRDLGVPKPSTQMTLTETVAGVGTDEERFYAYTYLTDWDEEGPPNVSAKVVCKPGANFDITNLAPAPTGAGNNRGINRIRIYRTLTGDAGSAFYVLATIAIATSTTDNALEPGSDTLTTAKYALPPTDLKHLRALWNGIMAGISGKSVRYCEINRPHAWPASYETLLVDKPVALGAFQNTLIVATSGKPRAVTGDLPESMRDTPIDFDAPCVSQLSMVSFGHGCAWASKDGLAYVGAGGPPRILTAGRMTPDDWRALNPETMVGGIYRGAYMGFYDAGGGTLKGFMIDPMNPEAGVFGITTGFTAVHYDELEGELYGLAGTSIQKWNAGASKMTAAFKSKTFMMPRPLNMAVADVIADAYPCTFTLYAGARSPWVKAVTKAGAFKLPAGYLERDWAVRIDTQNDVTGLVVAESVDELAVT